MNQVYVVWWTDLSGLAYIDFYTKEEDAYTAIKTIQDNEEYLKIGIECKSIPKE
jgi:hypothetical protein